MLNWYLYCFSRYKQWTSEEVKDWQRHRQRGLTRFVVVDGVFKWGVVAFALFQLFTFRTLSTGDIEADSYLLHSGLLWLLAAVIHGKLVWNATNIAYSKQH